MPSTVPPSPEKLAEELERVRLMHRIGRLIDPGRDPKGTLKAILRETVRTLRASSGSICQIDPVRQMLVIEEAVNIEREAKRSTQLRIGEGVTGRVAETGKALRVNDVTRSPYYVSIREGVKSEMAAPLLVDGGVVGVLNVDADRINAFSSGDETLLRSAAEEATHVMQVARLHQQLRDQSSKLETLYRVGQTITTASTLTDVLHRIAAETRSVMDAKVCSIMLLNEEGRKLTIEATAGAAETYTGRPALSVSGTLVGGVVMSRTPRAVYDVRTARNFSQIAMARREGLCSLLCVPILFLDKTIGALNVYMSEPREFGQPEIRLLEALAGQSAVAIENARRTERIAEAEKQLRHSEKLSVLGALAAEIAHEVRNPITIIEMLVESLKGSLTQGDPARRDIEIILSKLGQIDRIVDKVLDVARARERHFEPFDVGEAVEDTLVLTERRLAALGIELRRRFASDLPWVEGDRGEVEQALLNLILNACDAMPSGGRLSISTRVKKIQGEPYVSIRVADTGSGIAADQIDRIFTPFHTTRPDGVGMGLFVAHKTMKSHHGDLTVKSRPGEGAVFEATLPVGEEASRHA